MKALLIDDHPLILAGMQSVMRRFREGVCIACAETASAAREVLAADSCFDIVLLDLQLGHGSGFELLEELRSTYPALSVVVISSSDSNDDVSRAIYLGATGFILKRASDEILFDALSLVMAGGIYVPPIVMASDPPAAVGRRDSHGWGLRTDRFQSGNASFTRSFAAALGLTPRQTDVLELLFQGLSNKRIARTLNLSAETIKDHVAAVLRTLNVRSRTEAVLAVSQRAERATPLVRRH